MGWFEKDIITNFGDWRTAFNMQAKAEKEEREFMEAFLPKLLTYLGVGLVLIIVMVLIIPKKSST